MTSRLEPRGLLDADNPLASILNPIEQALGGVTQEDVASGAVDLAGLSRSEKATLAIDGELPSLLDAVARPWSVGLDVSAGDVLKLAATGGGAMRIRVSEPFASALVDKLIPPRFALLWDDQIVEVQGTLEIGAFSDTQLVLRVGPPRGVALTLWCTDNDVAFELLEVVSASEVEALRKRATDAAQGGPKDEGFLGGFARAMRETIDTLTVTYGVTTVAVAAVAGVVLLIWLRGQSKGGG